MAPLLFMGKLSEAQLRRFNPSLEALTKVVSTQDYIDGVGPVGSCKVPIDVRRQVNISFDIRSARTGPRPLQYPPACPAMPRSLLAVSLPFCGISDCILLSARESPFEVCLPDSIARLRGARSADKTTARIVTISVTRGGCDAGYFFQGPRGGTSGSTPARAFESHVT